MASPLQEALDALLRPLEFAARDGFAQADRIVGLAASVASACHRARSLALPPDLDERLAAVEELLVEPRSDDHSDGDPGLAAREQRALWVQRALELLAPVSRVGWVDGLLDRSPAEISGVGPKRSALLAKRGIGTIADLLFHLPIRYDDRRALVRVGDLQVGAHATFIAQVKSVGSSRRRGRFGQVLEAVVGDETGSVVLKWFRHAAGLESRLQPGAQICVSGDVRRYRFSVELIHPEIEIVGAPDSEASDERGELSAQASAVLDGMRRIVPAYSTPEGIPPRTLRRLVETAVAQYSDAVAGQLPADLVYERGLPEPAEALRAIHSPDSDSDVERYLELASPAHERLVLEELYLLELGLSLRRAAQAAQPGIAIAIRDETLQRLSRELPFELTRAQQRSWREISHDLSRPHPMSRLLQGDVGSGKTAVAYLAAVTVVAGGHQVALMAPTELLAEQHARTLASLSQGSSAPIRIALLTASVPRPQAKEIREGLRRGEIDLVVGTQALVQEDVLFESLALAIVDEQHRFGVLQRAALAAKAAEGRVPHSLVMTATPIPRTLALTLYGDLDCSLIDELPPGRSPVETLLLRDGEGERVVDLIRETSGRGEQVYVVYPLVEESEKIDLRAAVTSAERIANAFQDLSVGLVHGRQKSSDRSLVMGRFESGELDLLVSTSVIEVGVDISNATLIVVEHAERFGLAQLHQLRGRVGRGERPGTCILVARGGGEESEARLRAMLETTDGFRIADADLRIRGPGEFLGTQQSGHLPDLRIADLVRDAELVRVARDTAQQTEARDPGLRSARELRQAVELRWGERLALVGVG